MPNSKRSKQFLAFDALAGYRELIKSKEIIVEEKKILSEDELNELNLKFSLIKSGMMVQICFYDKNHYECIKGMVSKIDLVFKKIYIVKKAINFFDIVDIIL